MATSGSTDFTLNRDEIIKEAFSTIEIGVEGEALDPEEIVIGARNLNIVLKAMQGRGMGLWLRDTKSITLVAAQSLYTLGATGNVSMVRPLRILECNRKDSTGSETSMTPMSIEEYEGLPNKSQSGVPVNYHYNPTLSNGSLYLWLVPSTAEAAEYTVEIVFRTEIEDMDVAADNLDMPTEFMDAVILALAYRLAPKYGYPINERYLLRKDAKEALDDALAFDQEQESLFIQPDFR